MIEGWGNVRGTKGRDKGVMSYDESKPCGQLLAKLRPVLRKIWPLLKKFSLF
jgi:hypothetical protein